MTECDGRMLGIVYGQVYTLIALSILLWGDFETYRDVCRAFLWPLWMIWCLGCLGARVVRKLVGRRA